MDNEAVLSALKATVTEVMGTMAWAEVGFAGQDHSSSLILDKEVGGLIRLQGDHEGLVGIACSKNIASELVSRIVGLPAEELTHEDLLDGVAELANMICGGMKTKAEIGNLELSPPVAIVGSEYTALWKTMEGTEILNFLLEGEMFQVHVSM
uniref:Chemotaxis phosphatase CheX-like domain-containing protein n=1 Tax=Magnetococcus massalia (strain MO-1) TaxID=451514 RepID=A0A1S7LKL9_MAGMO|nr:conserved protein of unknown function [Candidatus Magnetococcus massalia]